MTIEYTDAERTMLGGLTEIAEAGLEQLLDDYERRNLNQLTELQRALDSATHFALGPITQARVEFLNNWHALLESRLNGLNKLVIPADDELVAQAKATIENILENLRQLNKLTTAVQKQISDEVHADAKKQLDLQKELGKNRTVRFTQYAEKKKELQRQRWRS